MKKPHEYACATYDFCVCSNSSDGHCIYCLNLPIDHDLEACRTWEKELKKRQEAENAFIQTNSTE